MALTLSAMPFSALLALLLLADAAESARSGWAVAAEEEGGVGDCMNALMSMMPCLDYITDRAGSPPTGCCVELEQVLRSQPLCLCHILNGDVSKVIGLPVDKSRALDLPGICKLSTPPIAECNSLTLPPLVSSAPPTPPTPSTKPLPPSGGAQPAAAPAPLSSGTGSRTRWSLQLLAISSIIYVFLF